MAGKIGPLATDLVATLRKQAQDIANQGINGWGNTMLRAADEIERLRDALQGLCDEQNDAPLERRREQWQRAYDQARALLRTGT